MNKNEKGFSVVEGLLTVVVIGLTGFVGWYVWHNRATKPVNSPAANTPPAKTTTTAPVKTVDPNAGYLVIKEWGVKLPLNNGLSLSYSIKDKAATIRSAELDKLSGTNCTANSVIVERGKATERVTPESGEGSTFLETYNSTTLNTTNPDNIRAIKAKVGDYYFVAPGYASASCIDIPYENPEGKAKQEAETQAQLSIVKAIDQVVVL